MWNPQHSTYSSIASRIKVFPQHTAGWFPPWRNLAHPFNFPLIKPEKTALMWPKQPLFCTRCSTRARSPGSRPAEQKKTWQHLFVKVCHLFSGNLIIMIVVLEPTPTWPNLPPLPVEKTPYLNICNPFILYLICSWVEGYKCSTLSMSLIFAQTQVNHNAENAFRSNLI